MTDRYFFTSYKSRSNAMYYLLPIVRLLLYNTQCLDARGEDA